MNVFSLRSSHLFKHCTCQVLDHACAGLLREVSKRGCKATSATSIESLDKDADTIEDVDLAGFLSKKKQTGDSFQKVSDSGFYRKSIAAREQFANKRDSRNNLGRRFDNAQRPGLKFVKEDDLGGKEKKEVVRKQKPINEVKESKTINGRSVFIEYVPRGISLHDIRKALSVYGEIVGCFLRPGNNGMVGCHLEYKTNEAKERALSDRWVVVNGKQLSVCRVDFPVTTTVRIACLGSQTSVYEIHSVCTSVGQIKSLQMREDGSVDVTFSVSESRIMPKILEKLNEVTLNDSRWKAQPAPRLSQCLAETPEGQSWVGEQLSNRISNLKKQLQLKRIYLEDMEELHNAIMHVKECPNLVNNEAFDTM